MEVRGLQQTVGLLTAAEEVALTIRAQDDDPADALVARDLLIGANIRLVLMLARRQRRPDLYEDLISDGILGLIHAIRLYDPNRGTRFTTFASHWVRAEMQECRRRHLLVHVPSYAYSLRGRDDAGLGENNREAAAAARKFTRGGAFVPFDAARDAWQETEAVGPGELAELREAVDALPWRERAVVVGCLIERRLQREMGLEMGLTRVSIARLLGVAMTRLRERLEANHDAD